MGLFMKVRPYHILQGCTVTHSVRSPKLLSQLSASTPTYALKNSLCMSFSSLHPVKPYFPQQSSLITTDYPSLPLHLQATGNYFDQGLVPSDVAFTKHSSPAVPITEERKLPAGTQPLSSKGGLPTYASGVRALPSTQAQKPLQMQAPLQVLLRQWTLGEIVTSVARSGLVISCLEEEQGVRADDAGHPKTFTLVAMKALS